MKIYLAGPMTGYHDFNRAVFDVATEDLCEQGYDVHSPILADLETYGSWERATQAPWEEHLKRDMNIVPTCDAIALLPGWEASKGANLELAVARAFGLLVYVATESNDGWTLTAADPYGQSLASLVGTTHGYELGPPQEGPEATKTTELYGDDGSFIPYADNPERQRSVTGGVKDNRSKSRVDLIPSKPLLGVGQVLAYGARKYKPHNWRLGLGWSDTQASAMRHMLAFADGEDLDPETGLSHVDHALCQLLFLSEYVHTGTGTDDRFVRLDPEEAKA